MEWQYRKSKDSYLIQFKLSEFPVIFEIGHFEIKAFDKTGFSELYPGDRVSVAINPLEKLNDATIVFPGQVSAYGKCFIDEDVRDFTWRSEAWMAVFMSFLFTAGLIHHLKRPWYRA